MSQLAPRGVRKVSELVLQEGRALILTEEDAAKLDWVDIPDGSIKINKYNGIMAVKLNGQADWVPAGIKNDGTLCIAKDSTIVREELTITELPRWLDEEQHFLTGQGGLAEFKYTNSDGEQRIGKITNGGKVLTFTVEKGTYMKGRNHLDVVLDGVLLRNAQNGGLTEVSENMFSLSEKLEVGETVEAKYIRVFRIGNPYPRIFMSNDSPSDAEVGDMWLDCDETVESADELLGEKDTEATISWDRITGRPTSLAGLVDTSGIAATGHHHKVRDIDDFPIWMLNKQGSIDADSVKGHVPGSAANNLLVVGASGKIDASVISNHTHSIDDLTGITIGTTAPANPVNNKSIWFCTAAGNSGVKVYTNNAWISLGAGWEA